MQQDIPISSPPKRLVSLVPSVTESLFVMGLGNSLVGITDYCTDPPEAVKNLKRIGGPKNPRADEIVALRPDLVIANKEENARETVEVLLNQGVPVWVTFPKTVREALDDLLKLAAIYQSQQAGRQVENLLRILDLFEASCADQQPISYFCPIWQEEIVGGIQWWMTFNQDTYPHDVLRLSGGSNIFATRNRRYPMEADLGLVPEGVSNDRDVRYPRVTLDEVLQADPELILLPTEPYPYTLSEIKNFQKIFNDTRAGKSGRIVLIDGKLIMWYGVHISKAINQLPSIFL